MTPDAVDGISSHLMQSAPEGFSESEIAARRAAMRVLVEADESELAGLLGALDPLPAHDDLRPAETGLVMVRGRIGGDGSPFNLGEATVSRATVRLAGGELGFGYVLGRNQEKARLVALCDALFQYADFRAAVEEGILAPLRARIAAERQQTDEQTAAKRVDFFTLVRGED